MDLLLDYKVFSLTVTVKNGEEAQRGTCRGGKSTGSESRLGLCAGKRVHDEFPELPLPLDQR